MNIAVEIAAADVLKPYPGSAVVVTSMSRRGLINDRVAEVGGRPRVEDQRRGIEAPGSAIIGIVGGLNIGRRIDVELRNRGLLEALSLALPRPNA